MQEVFGSGLEATHVTSACVLWARLTAAATHNCQEGSALKRKSKRWPPSWRYCCSALLWFRASAEQLGNTRWGAEHFPVSFISPHHQPLPLGSLGENFEKSHCNVTSGLCFLLHR